MYCNPPFLFSFLFFSFLLFSLSVSTCFLMAVFAEVAQLLYSYSLGVVKIKLSELFNEMTRNFEVGVLP